MRWQAGLVVGVLVWLISAGPLPSASSPINMVTMAESAVAALFPGPAAAPPLQQPPQAEKASQPGGGRFANLDVELAEMDREREIERRRNERMRTERRVVRLLVRTGFGTLTALMWAWVWPRLRSKIPVQRRLRAVSASLSVLGAVLVAWGLPGYLSPRSTSFFDVRGSDPASTLLLLTGVACIGAAMWWPFVATGD